MVSRLERLRADLAWLTAQRASGMMVAADDLAALLAVADAARDATDACGCAFGPPPDTCSVCSVCRLAAALAVLDVGESRCE